MLALCAIRSWRCQSAACGIGLSLLAGSAAAAPYSAYLAFGDSITPAGWPWPVYPQLLAKANGWRLLDRAVGGYTACQGSINEVIGGQSPVIKLSGNPIFTVMFGANDAFAGGKGPYEAVYKDCLAAQIAWLSVPNKVLGPAATATGTWSPFTFTVNGYPWLAQGTAVASSQPGASIAFTVPVGVSGTLYAWYGWIANRVIPSGAFTYSVDGGAPVRVMPLQYNSHTVPDTAAAGLQMLRITGLPPGEHTISATLGELAPSQGLAFFAAGTPPAAPVTEVLVGGILRRHNDAFAAATAAYDADARSVVDDLVHDGLRVTFVPVRDYVNDTTDMADDVHPNAAAQALLEQAFADHLKARTDWSAEPLPTKGR
jgi:lysophospholipase L1-like esterase